MVEYRRGGEIAIVFDHAARDIREPFVAKWRRRFHRYVDDECMIASRKQQHCCNFRPAVTAELRVRTLPYISDTYLVV
jgi:hypothetical protein